MANEITIQNGLTIKNGNLDYVSRPNSFRITMNAVGGPTIGQVSVPTTGVDVDTTLVTQPGVMRVMNLDTANYIVLGMKTGSDFLPLLEVGPGETYVLKLYRYLGEVFVGTGSASGTSVLHAVANTASCKVIFEVFEK